MLRPRLGVLTLLGLWLGLSATVVAHHSFVAFDEEAEATVTGRITSFSLRNPHTYFLLEVVNEDGQTISYKVESETRNDLLRNGWTDDSLMLGESINATVNPARDPERHYGRLLSLVKSDGTYLEPPNEQDESGRRNAVPAASLEGVWLPIQTFRQMFAEVEPLVTEHARAERTRLAAARALPANVDCLNFASLPLHLGRARVFEIEFAGDDLVLMHGEDLEFPRQIHLDGREHPEVVAEEDMAGMGHSIGHWEGDTLVIDTRHFRPRAAGNTSYPSGPQRHLIERYRLSEDRTRIIIHWTLDDPGYLSAPLSLTFQWQHSPHIVRQPWSCDAEAAAEYLN